MQCHLRLRPLLRMKTPHTPDEVVRRLRETLPVHAASLTGTISGYYVILRIHDARQHFGSPQLSFEVEPLEDGSELSGLFMPMPTIWTAFMALYALILFGGFSAGCYGYAQLKLDHAPTALWGIPIALLLLGAVHGVACVGQRRGEDQMQELRQFVDRTLA